MAKKQKYSVSAVAQALRNANGVKAEAARILNCDWDTVHSYCKKYPECEKAAETGRNILLDMAENVIFVKVMERDVDAAKFVLTRLGRERGWGTTVETRMDDKQFEMMQSPRETLMMRMAALGGE